MRWLLADSVAMVAGLERGEGLIVRFAASEDEPRWGGATIFGWSTLVDVSSDASKEGLPAGADTLRLVTCTSILVSTTAGDAWI